MQTYTPTVVSSPGSSETLLRILKDAVEPARDERGRQACPRAVVGPECRLVAVGGKVAESEVPGEEPWPRLGVRPQGMTEGFSSRSLRHFSC